MKKIFFALFLLLIGVLSLLIYIRITSGEPVFPESLRGTASDDTRVPRLDVTFLDIGQGDATFISFPNGQQMLVDCAIDARILEALGRVMPFYDRSIDYLLITHPDKDHYGGCEDVLERFDIGHIVYTGVQKEGNQSWQSYMYAQYDEGAAYTEIAKEDVWNIGSTTVHFFYPDHSVREGTHIPGVEKDTGPNNTSIIFSLEYMGKRVLLTGDVEAELEAYLVATYGVQLDTDVLKVGHHGSPGSSIPEFLTATSPAYAIISSGKGNSYGHPSARVLKKLERIGAETWRTDEKGDILVSIMLNSLYVGPP